MKQFCLLVVFLLIAIPVEAQQMVKVNPLEFYDQIPLPPADAREAYTRAGCTVAEADVNCDADKPYRPLEDRLAGIDKDFEKVTLALAQPRVQAAQKVDAEAMKKKMKNMSKAERMQYAMQMSQSMGMAAQPMAPESPAVTAAWEECNKLVQAESERIQKTEQILKERRKPGEKREAQHSEIDAWTEAEMKKLPRISTGEMDYIEPKALHALKTKAMQKHIAVENEYLAAVRTRWMADREKFKELHTPYQQKLAAIHYGEDVRNPDMKQPLVNGHIMMFTPVKSLIAESRTAMKEAAEWWGRKVMLEQEKPQ